MPAAGLREIDKTLRKVDEGIREFSARYEQNRGASGPSGEREAHREALRKAHAALQKHGAQIKRWTSQGDESWKSARTRLEDALAKIEDATRRMAELEAAEGEDGAKAPVAAAQPLQGEAAEAEQGANEPSSHKVQADQLLRDACDDSDMLEEFVCKICQVYVVGIRTPGPADAAEGGM
ncbi:unnamed protein product [Prorocentrum cordatum]|uniref:CCR4-Not complex component Not N-terminal domain-containing protein n=1 Tax=Prorocentrum cordatum TaxID=2364126 RepID=A0ABN9SBF5_9DINO|nr:unnamed protein product [Polarella glacialis]